MQVTTPESVRERDESASVGEDVITRDTVEGDTISSAITALDDAVVIADVDDVSDELATAEAVVTAPPKIFVGVRTLEEQSKYRGEINTSGKPHGAGVLDSAFGSKYAGDFCDGKKHGYGVQVFINGSTYAGEFVDDQPSEHGVHTSPFAEKYMGQWAQSARNGMGVCMESNAQVVFGRFVDNELDAETQVDWKGVQEHMQRALVAERRALRSQEMARERHMQAMLEELSAVDTTTFEDAEQIAQFEAQEQQELQQFIREQSEIVAEVERVADSYKFREAELKQHQKLLRIDIDAKTKELSYLAKFCTLASERRAQVVDAERTLNMLQGQLHEHVLLSQLQPSENGPTE